MPDQVSIHLLLHPARAEALAQLVKRASRQNLGRSGLNLASPHEPGEEHEMGQALDDLRRALAEAGFDPR